MKSLIFSTPMVKAILAGHKTMTRRVVKPQPVLTRFGRWHWMDARSLISSYTLAEEMQSAVSRPYKPGDVLWVRETWCEYAQEHIVDGQRFAYKATANEDCHNEYIKHGYPYKWRPSIYMPREDARIFLKVTDVRAERLREISEDDAMKEGFQSTATEFGGCAVYANKYEKALDIECPDGCNCLNSRENFAGLWDASYAKKPEFQWDKSPYVWVIAFERTEKP